MSIVRVLIYFAFACLLSWIIVMGNGCAHYAAYYACKSPKWLVSFKYDNSGGIESCTTCDIYEVRATGKCEIRKHTGDYCKTLQHNVEQSCKVIR